MIPLKRVPLLFAIFLTFPITGLAQKFCTVAPPSPFKHNALIVTSYDQRARRMKTTLEHPNTLGNGLRLYASFFYQDPRLASIQTIDIFFINATKKPAYRESHDLSFLTDGNPLPLSGMAQYYMEDGPKGTTLEKTKITLTYASLQGLLKSKRVTARLGATEFQLSHNHLESLREIAMLMAPPQPVRVAKR
jgi:hypothetical protein